MLFFELLSLYYNLTIELKFKFLTNISFIIMRVYIMKPRQSPFEIFKSTIEQGKATHREFQLIQTYYAMLKSDPKLDNDKILPLINHFFPKTTIGAFWQTIREDPNYISTEMNQELKSKKEAKINEEISILESTYNKKHERKTPENNLSAFEVFKSAIREGTVTDKEFDLIQTYYALLKENIKAFRDGNKIPDLWKRFFPKLTIAEFMKNMRKDTNYIQRTEDQPGKKDIIHTKIEEMNKQIKELQSMREKSPELKSELKFFKRDAKSSQIMKQKEEALIKLKIVQSSSNDIDFYLETAISPRSDESKILDNLKEYLEDEIKAYKASQSIDIASLLERIDLAKENINVLDNDIDKERALRVIELIKDKVTNVFPTAIEDTKRFNSRK
jgi:hypothetical protein